MPSSEPRIASAARSGMRHQPGHVAGRIEDPGNRPERAVGVRRVAGLGGGTGRIDVAEEDLPVALQGIEGHVVRVVAALAMGHRHAQRAPRGQGMGERRVESRGGDGHVPADEAKRRVAQECAGHEARLGEDLEAVADPQDEAAAGRKRGNRPHDRAEPGDRTGPKVVAVGEATGRTTAATPSSVACSCHRLTARHRPRSRACSVSRSQLLPGKTTTPIRTATSGLPRHADDR